MKYSLKNLINKQMKVNNYEILISSPYDREYLVAEIWHSNDLIAEINQERGFWKLNFTLEVIKEFDFH